MNRGRSCYFRKIQFTFNTDGGRGRSGGQRKHCIDELAGTKRMRQRKEEERTAVRRRGREKGELNGRGGNPEGAPCASTGNVPTLPRLYRRILALASPMKFVIVNYLVFF